MQTGGQGLVAALRALDVEVAFGLPGVHNLAAWKAFPGSRRAPGRASATSRPPGYAADGYARATGRLGVALTTTGPGAANVVTAVGEAWACHTPLLVIATDIPSTRAPAGRLPRGAARDDRPGVASSGRSPRRRCASPRVEELPSAVARRRPARAAAPAPPGLPRDPDRPAQRGRVTARAPAEPLLPALPAPAAGRGRPGRGAARRRARGRWSGPVAARPPPAPAAAVAALAARLGAPVLTSYGGRGLLPPDDPSPRPPAAALPGGGRRCGTPPTSCWCWAATSTR